MDKKEVPEWFYYISILLAFLFTIYISIYATIHFESIKYMNLVVVFLFMTISMFFLITAVYFKTEKLGLHTLSPILFFAGVVSLIFYAYKAVDASDIVRFSVIYTIIVLGISLFILLQKKKKTVEAVQSAVAEPAFTEPVISTVSATIQKPAKRKNKKAK